MGQYSLKEFDTWYNTNNSEISDIYQKEGGIRAYPKLADRLTNSGGTGIYMIDSEDNSTIREFYFAIVSDEDITKNKNLVAEEHFTIIQRERQSYPCYELLIQVDSRGKQIDYTKRKIS